ncbi:MAG: helix-turn-helix domain-containing protein [Sphingomonadaceae bacterium]|nr:helix-turn-helix domain-containing protein [Sphingomonadaceae bacterium]
MSDALTDAPMLALDRVGDRLRAARLAAGLNLSDIADETRVPLRHLEAIESNDFSTLPSFTYATGFVRAFARIVGEDEVVLIRDLRVELGRDQDSWTAASGDNVADPARIPPKWLAWTAALIMLAFVGGYGLWRSTLFDPQSAEAEQAPLAPRPAVPVRPAAAPVAPAALPTGPVLLMAIDDVWVRIYDKTGKVLFQGIIKKGESYAVPPEANGPMIRTGRADQIAVTIGGVSVPPLGPANQTLSNVPVNAAALAARPSAPAPEPTVAPAPTQP